MAGSPRSTLTIEISHKTFFWILAIAFALWFVFQIKTIIVALFISFIFMSALAPLVDFFDRLKVPTVLGILFTYLAVLVILLLAIVAVIPPVVTQTEALMTRLPIFVGNTLTVLGFARDDDYLRSVYIDHVVQYLRGQLGGIGRGVLQLTLGLFSGVVAFLTTMVVSFYLLLDRRRLHQNFVSFFPLGYQEEIRKVTLRVERQLGLWMRGQLALMIVVGLMTFVGLSLLGIPYTLPLAMVAGFLEVVPMIGPVIAAIPAVIIAATLNPLQGVMVAILYTLIQQLENNLIVPQVMRRAVGLNPLIVIIALAIGAKLMGIPGALLAVPTATIIFILADETLNLSLEDNSSFWTSVTASSGKAASGGDEPEQ